MRIAFLVLAHRGASQIERLCVRLHPHNVFVHVDARTTTVPIERLAALERVTVVTPRRAVYWGDFSMVEATLTLLKAARATDSFDRYVLLSGECYPAKPITALEDQFNQSPHSEWVSLTPITADSLLTVTIGRHWRMTPFATSRVLDVRLRALWNKVSKLRGRDLQREIGVTPYFGSQWFGLSAPCVDMILEFVPAHPEFTRAYRTIYAPDEHFFHTIIGNSPFGASAVHVIDQGFATNQSAPLHQIAPTEDRYFRNSEEDFQVVRRSSKPFIRKVSLERTEPLLNRIDTELLRGMNLKASNEP